MMLCPADTNEKTSFRRTRFFGSPCWARTSTRLRSLRHPICPSQSSGQMASFSCPLNTGISQAKTKNVASAYIAPNHHSLALAATSYLSVAELRPNGEFFLPAEHGHFASENEKRRECIYCSEPATSYLSVAELRPNGEFPLRASARSVQARTGNIANHDVLPVQARQRKE